MKNKLRGKSKIEYLMLLLIAVEGAFIIYMNIFKCRAYPEMDMAKLYRHAIEIVRNRSVIISGWNYITTMELDCSLFIALPIYALIGDIYISFGISNILFTVFFVFILYDILRKINTKPVYKYVAVIFALIPYRMGMLEYTNMLFYNGGQYIVKVLEPLLFIDLMIEEDVNLFTLNKPKNAILSLIMCFFMILTSFSSGTYVLVSGIIPIVIAYVLNVILSGDIQNVSIKKAWLIGLNLVSFIFGYILCRRFNINPGSEGMDIVAPNNLLDNIKLTVWGFFSIFVNPDPSSVMSINGLFQLIRYIFSIVIAMLILFDLTCILKKGEEYDKQRILSFVFMVTFFILSFTKCCFSDTYYPSRYFLIGLIPVFLTVPCFLQWIEEISVKRINRLFTNMVYVLLAILTMSVWGIGVYNTREEIRHGNDGGYASVKAILSYAADNGINNVLWLYDLPDGEVARLFAPEIRSGVVNFTDDGTPFIDPARDFYTEAGQSDHYQGENLLVEKNGSGDYDRLSEDIRNKFKTLGNVEGYNIYLSSECVF